MDPEEIINKLEQLNVSSKELDVSESGRLEMLSQVSDYINKFISRLSEVKGFNEKKPGILAIKSQKRSLPELLHLYQKEVAENGINAASAKHLGYIPGGGVFTAALADFIAAITNPFAGVYYASPGAATIENEVIEWLKSVFSFPENAAGCLSSGGSISTLIAFTAARDKHKVRNDGSRKVSFILVNRCIILHRRHSALWP